jgi:hypothetical protein
MFNIRKNREKRKLVKYLAKLNNKNVKWPEGYLESRKNLIGWIEWLIAYYEGRAAATPKQILESMLDPYMVKECVTYEEIKFLYHWVYYKRITGF